MKFYGCYVNLVKKERITGQGQPRVMIYINFVALQTLMLHAKFQGNLPSGVGEEVFFKVLSNF